MANTNISKGLSKAGGGEGHFPSGPGVHVAPEEFLRIPPSVYMSGPARQCLAMTFKPPSFSAEEDSIDAHRLAWDEYYYRPRLDQARLRYPAKVERRIVGGVPVDWVTPSGVPVDAENVLINLHGGAFLIGGGMGGLVESLPLAHHARMQVASVDYRQAPEYRFPAASEDVAAVYRTLLHRHKPERVALVGCSAGGLLVAQSLAWLQQQGLPAPACAAILFAPAEARFSGDSRYIAPLLTGQPPPADSDLDIGPMALYMEGSDLASPLASPLLHKPTLAGFPPIFLATGGRAGDMSAVVNTHLRLLQAGCEALLHVWDGMWHGFQYDIELPETREFYECLANFLCGRITAEGTSSSKGSVAND